MTTAFCGRPMELFFQKQYLKKYISIEWVMANDPMKLFSRERSLLLEITGEKFYYVMLRTIVYRGNIKGVNKDVKIYVGRPTTVRNLLFYVRTLCSN